MLITHRALHGAELARGLADVLAAPPADPFAAEVVAVPAKGVERWLAQRLSHVLGTSAGDGVCANVAFPWPSTLVDEALAAASAEHAGAVERWAPARSVWPLLDVIDASVPPPSRGAGRSRSTSGTDAEDKGRRLAVARRLAGMFDEYGQSRPEMLRAWAAGRDERGDGSPLDEDLALAGRAVAPAPRAPRYAEPGRAARRRLRAAARPAGAERPARRASRSSAPAGSPPPACRCSPRSPSTATCTCGCTTPRPRCGTPSPQAKPALRRKDDATRRQLANPLLTSLSRDVLELQQLIARSAPGSQTVLHDSAPNPDTLLGRLKQDLADDRVQDSPPPLDRDRPQRPGARLPRPHPPGRGAPRGHRRTARRRPHPRAARRPRHVPRRRDLRADRRGHLRDRRRGRRRPPGGQAARPARRPRAAADQRAARRAVPAARARHRPAHRQPGARPRRHPGGAAAVRVRRRRARAAARLDGRLRRPLGPRQRPPRHLAARRRRAGHLARRARPAAARRRHGGRPRQLGRRRTRSTTSTAPTSTWPAGSPSWSTGSPPRST